MKETAKPTFKYAIVINGNTLAINTTKEELKLNKPSYLGMCILDLKKTPMYDFYYNYITKLYGDRANQIQIHFVIMRKLRISMRSTFGLINIYLTILIITVPSRYYFSENKKVIGKMKDERRVPLCKKSLR